MTDDFWPLKVRLRKWWVFSPERLWLASIALNRRGHIKAAFALKQLNWLIYRNSLHPGATVSPDVQLGHHSMGIVVDSPVTVGRRVKIWQNVTLTARPAQGAPADIVIGDDVVIGANAVVISPRGKTLHIGRGARIGAGAVVTRDVPERATLVSAPTRLIEREESRP